MRRRSSRESWNHLETFFFRKLCGNCIWHLLIRCANCDAEEILGVETPEDFSADPLGVETRLFRAL